jgi:hypothetical protein
VVPNRLSERLDPRGQILDERVWQPVAHELAPKRRRLLGEGPTGRQERLIGLILLAPKGLPDTGRVAREHARRPADGVQLGAQCLAGTRFGRGPVPCRQLFRYGVLPQLQDRRRDRGEGTRARTVGREPLRTGLTELVYAHEHLVPTCFHASHCEPPCDRHWSEGIVERRACRSRDLRDEKL